ncbi:MAG: bifunctional metallophosphatase/5'-nucleotidase [Pirellulales bacterium]
MASNIVDKTMPPSYSEGLRFTLGREELPKIIEQVRSKEKVDLVVLISHLGFPQDMKLLSEVPGVDVCLSGHTHNRLYEPAQVGKTPVIQSGCHGSFIGRLDLEVKNGQIVNHRHKLIEVSANIKPDEEVDALIRKLMAPYDKELAEVVGETATALNRGTMLESTMDNLLLKAMLEASGAEIAFSNGWRWGAPVVPGKVTLNDLNNVVVVNPPVSTVDLTGKELLAMLEENLEHTFSGNAYEQMGGYVKRCAGLTLHIKIENPAGYRIQKLFVGNEEVQPAKVYKATFITQQGVPAKYGRNRRNLPEHAVDVLRAYLAKYHPARADIQGSVVAE